MFTRSPKVERLQEVIEADGFNQGGHLMLGDEYLREGRFMNAAAKFRRVVELNPDHAEAWQKMGEAYDRLGVKKEAERAFNSAARAYTLLGKAADAQACENRAKALAS